MGKRRRKEYRLSKAMRKKLVVLLSILMTALLVLIVRLFYIHFVSGERYEKIVLDQQGYSSVTIPFKRGDILDRNKTLLATSSDVYNVILDCKVLNAKEKCIEPTIKAITSCFSITEEEVRGYLKDRADSQYCVLLKKIPYEEIKEFQAIAEDKKEGTYIAGVWFEKEYIRVYPNATLAAHVVGFITSGNEGINGLEQYYNDLLNGIDGRKYGYLNSDSDYEITVKNAVNGKSIVSTIDANIQSIVERKIKEFNAQYAGVKLNTNGDNPEGTEGEGSQEEVYSFGSEKTAVIVMDPNTSEILAMAQYPTYDLNNPRDLTAYYSQDAIDAMTEDDKFNAMNKIWQNYCITNTYEPGSTAKPFTVAAGLDSGKLNGDEKYNCDGYEHIGGHNIRCVKREGHGWEDLELSIANSCNDALMQIGAEIGVDTFTKYQAIFGFGRKTNIDLYGEARTDTLIYTAENMSATSLATNSFGQNFNVTMIQLASGYASLINGGYYYQPHLVKQVLNDDGTVAENIEPTLVKQTISEETSSYIRRYLYTTVMSGTGKSAHVEGYTMGGKTGTAQKLPRGNKKYLVSFIGHVPAVNPQVLIYVVVDEPNVQNQAQSSLATNLAKEILTEVLPYMNIFPDEGEEGTEPTIGGTEENYEGDIFE